MGDILKEEKDELYWKRKKTNYLFHEDEDKKG